MFTHSEFENCQRTFVIRNETYRNASSVIEPAREHSVGRTAGTRAAMPATGVVLRVLRAGRPRAIPYRVQKPYDVTPGADPRTATLYREHIRTRLVKQPPRMPIDALGIGQEIFPPPLPSRDPTEANFRQFYQLSNRL